MPKTIDTSSERGRLRLVVCAFAYPIAQITTDFTCSRTLVGTHPITHVFAYRRRRWILPDFLIQM